MITIFQAGADIISTGMDLHEAVDAAKSFGFSVNYSEIECADKVGCIDGVIYYTNDYSAI